MTPASVTSRPTPVPGAIPRLIHQTWREPTVPPQWAAAAASWRSHHPDFGYQLWTDAMARDLVARERPTLLAAYDALPYAIQRADAFRYAVLWAHGGIYADLDLEALCSLGPVIASHRLLLAREPEGHTLGGRARPACNAFLAAPPRHPFLERLLERLEAGGTLAVTHLDVLASTGPLFLDDVLRSYDGDDVEVLDSTTVYPLSKKRDADTIGTLQRNDRAAERVRDALRARGSYAVHYWANSWVPALAGTLDNPAPREIAGYRFFAGWDAPGDDLVNLGRHVATVARRCELRADAAGFNTDGFAKALAILERPWKRRQRSTRNEGLYVKEALWQRRSRWRSALFVLCGRRPFPP